MSLPVQPYCLWLSDDQICELFNQSLLQMQAEDAGLAKKLADQPPGYFCSQRGLNPDPLCFSCTNQFICDHALELQS